MKGFIIIDLDYMDTRCLRILNYVCLKNLAAKPADSLWLYSSSSGDSSNDDSPLKSVERLSLLMSLLGGSTGKSSKCDVVISSLLRLNVKWLHSSLLLWTKYLSSYYLIIWRWHWQLRSMVKCWITEFHHGILDVMFNSWDE